MRPKSSVPESKKNGRPRPLTLRKVTIEMSENTTTDTDTAAQIPAAGTLEHVDPQTLEFETNVRDDDAALDADFVASIKEHGVLTPMAAVGRYDMVGSMGRVGACLLIG
jgi:hypothetical protein